MFDRLLLSKAWISATSVSASASAALVITQQRIR